MISKQGSTALRYLRFFLFSTFLFIASSSFATETLSHKQLIFITSKYCPFCKAWEQDIGSLYHRTTYAKKAPLRRIDITEVEFELPEMAENVVGTPTFLIFQNGREIGRIEGYQSAEMFFWALSEYIHQ